MAHVGGTPASPQQSVSTVQGKPLPTHCGAGHVNVNGMVAPLSSSEPFSSASLARSGKTIVNVRDTPKNYPGAKRSCNPTNASGFVCTHKQSWSGHLIVTRTS